MLALVFTILPQENLLKKDPKNYPVYMYTGHKPSSYHRGTPHTALKILCLEIASDKLLLYTLTIKYFSFFTYTLTN